MRPRFVFGSRWYARWWLRYWGWMLPFCDPSEDPHPAMTVTDPDGQAIEVDDAALPLVEWLWDHGAKTLGSCQGSPDIADLWCMAEAAPYGAYVTLESARVAEWLMLSLNKLMAEDMPALYEQYRAEVRYTELSWYFVEFPGHVLRSAELLPHLNRTWLHGDAAELSVSTSLTRRCRTYS